MLSKALLTTALAATVLAATPAFPRHLADRAALQARQTDVGSATACLDGLLSVYSTAPTPPPSFKDLSVSVIDACHFTVPASLSSDFYKYESEVISWASVNEPLISSALAECPQYSSLVGQYSSLADQLPGVCSTGASASGSEATATSSGGSTAKTSGSSVVGTGLTTAKATTATGGVAGASSTHTAAGPRETGFVGAVVAVAGLLGVVAAL
ncbi:hypothetical protein B0H67DRAFT_644544 [Lasiosphaeris hirsuta]|uniref:Infection structure specific protein n=1 Tax=Lasiosphaeris hirsuta TaxID=260670 RepID=A0AA40AF43_9PEZI|nr:hypothetical protein B0H67DRAFT_644544 [Lasiosphaeris hirsuta]